jgi:sortase (surface protein transpeptidase)
MKISKRWGMRLAGLVIIALGGLLLAVALSYVIVPRLANAKLENELAKAKQVDTSTFFPSEFQQAQGEESPEAVTAAAEDPATPAATEAAILTPPPSLPLADRITFRYAKWDELRQTPQDLFPRAERIVIPAIDVDSKIVDLYPEKNDDGSLQWQTPKFSVGKFYTSPEPGAATDVWLWGHLQSYIRREGNVFERLPEVASYLANGEAVDVYIYAGNKVWVYRIIGAQIVKPEEIGTLLGHSSNEPTVNLVTCWPPQGYWNRFIATAKLLQVGDIS